MRNYVIFRIAVFVLLALMWFSRSVTTSAFLVGLLIYMSSMGDAFLFMSIRDKIIQEIYEDEVDEEERQRAIERFLSAED